MTDDDIIGDIIAREGGYVNHPNDSAGATNFGISRAALGAWRSAIVSVEDVRNLTIEEAREIYRKRYIYGPGINNITHDRLRDQVVDCAVLHGPKTAIRLLQAAVDVSMDGVLGPVTLAAAQALGDRACVLLTVHRLKHLAAIVEGNPSQIVFLRGWINRATTFL